jgi:hypothetical protein
MLEALLLVGVLEMAAEDRIVASGFSAEIKVVLVMLLVLGFFGSLLIALERFAKSGVGTTHRTIQALPIPTPRIFIHALLLFGLFLAYASVLNLWPSWFPA